MLYFRDIAEIGPSIKSPDEIEVLKYRNYLSKDIRIGLAQSRIILQRAIFEEVNKPQPGDLGPYKLNDYRLMLLAGGYGPCILTIRPITVAYRQHGGQASKTIEKMSYGVMELIIHVRRKLGPGRQANRFLQYAYLGGPVMEWTKKARQCRLYGLALRLIIAGWPMIGAAALRKLVLRFHRSSTRILIPAQQR